jgi:uncharacterized protein (TIGR03083 family)
MGHWNFFDYASKDTLLEVMSREADDFLALCSDPDTWTSPTASGHWETRDVAGHLVDTIEGYLPAFDAARGQGAVPDPLGLRDMNTHVNGGALAFRETSQAEVLERLRADRAKVSEIFAGLDEDDWSMLVPHKYMGPLPACFYPVFQLVDWAVHSWDIRQATGHSHVMAADAADLIVPVAFVLWQYTVDVTPDTQPLTIGVRVSGRNGGTTRISVLPDGVTVAPGDVSDLPATLEFDPASFVLTAFGRINGGTAHGDVEVADRFLNAIFRV